jgi:uncharacterized protein (TIGR01777 family)
LRVAVTGSSGLIGRAVTAALRGDGHQVIRLVRRAPVGQDEIAWDPGAPGAALDPRSLDGVAAVVHLAGAGIGDRPWTGRYKAQIRNSRVQGTTALVSALTAMAAPPGVMLSASAFGWYGDTGGREVTETAPAGRGFLAGVVRDWEAAAAEAARAGTRVVMLRSGLVLSRDGGLLGRLLPLFRLGLGARLGSGAQVMNWVALTDWVAVARFLLNHGDVAGPVNVTAPHPVTNAEFTSALAAAVHRPALLAVPVPALRLAVGGDVGDLLASARVMPERLLAAGYRFAYPDIAAALAAELSGP